MHETFKPEASANALPITRDLVHNAIGRQELTRPQAAVAGLDSCECREGAAAEACKYAGAFRLLIYDLYTMRVKSTSGFAEASLVPPFNYLP